MYLYFICLTEEFEETKNLNCLEIIENKIHGRIPNKDDYVSVIASKYTSPRHIHSNFKNNPDIYIAALKKTQLNKKNSTKNGCEVGYFISYSSVL